MAWDIADDPVNFDEAIAAFLALVPISDDAFDSLTESAKKKAFKVAGVAQLDVVQEVYDAIDAALEDGTSLEDFTDQIGELLESAWGGSVSNPGWRLETIFRTNVQTAYSRGRYQQAKDPDVAEDRPYWSFDAILDSHTTEVCDHCNGTTLPADDPWWASHIPPLHFNCRSTFITLTEEQAQQMGVAVTRPHARADEGFGDAPHDDSDSWEPDQADYDPELWNIYAAAGGDD